MDMASSIHPIRKVLIANRGEIACRVLRTCQHMGIITVTVYSTEDAHHPHVYLSDESLHLSGTTLDQTYLNIRRLIEIAQETQCDAIHPGRTSYGFTIHSGCLILFI